MTVEAYRRPEDVQPAALAEVQLTPQSSYDLSEEKAEPSTASHTLNAQEETTLKAFDVAGGVLTVMDQVQKPAYRLYQFRDEGFGINVSSMGKVFVLGSFLIDTGMLGYSIYEFTRTRDGEVLIGIAEQLPGLILESTTALKLGGALSSSLETVASAAPFLLGIGAGMLLISAGRKVRTYRRLNALKNKFDKIESITAKDLNTFKLTKLVGNDVLEKIKQRDPAMQKLLLGRLAYIKRSTALSAVTQLITAIAVGILLIFPPLAPFAVVPLLTLAAILSLGNYLTSQYKARQFGHELSKQLNNGSDSISPERKSSNWVKYGFLFTPTSYLINKGVLRRDGQEMTSHLL